MQRSAFAGSSKGSFFMWMAKTSDCANVEADLSCWANFVHVMSVLASSCSVVFIYLLCFYFVMVHDCDHYCLLSGLCKMFGNWIGKEQQQKFEEQIYFLLYIIALTIYHCRQEI